MDEETIKQYQDIYKFNKPIYAKGAKPNMPKINKTYLFVQNDGAIYIGTVIKSKGLYTYTIRIEKNINNILEVAEGNETQILIKYTDPGEEMFLWAEIPNYDSVDNLSEHLSMMNVNKKRKIDDFLIKEALKEDNDSRSIQTNNNSSRGPVVNVKRKHNRSTGSRTGIGGKGRKKTKRNRNKNRKCKTHRKR